MKDFNIKSKISFFGIIIACCISCMLHVMMGYGNTAVIIADTILTILALILFTQEKPCCLKKIHNTIATLVATLAIVIAVVLGEVNYLAISQILLFTYMAGCVLITGYSESFAKEVKDNLTSVRNRKGFEMEAERIKNEDSEDFVGLVTYDINGLKSINDKLGYEEGNKAIRTFADMLVEAFDSNTTIYRMEGDEFNIIVYGDNIENRINAAIENMTKSQIQYNTKASNEAKIEAAHGYAINTGEAFKDMCDVAYEKLRARKKEMQRPDFIMDEMAYKLIKHAILHDAVEPYYQPIRDNETGAFNRFEALMRINYDGKIYSPPQFMNYLKHSTQYVEISSQMIQKVFDTFRDMNATVSINISTKDIESDKIVNLIYENLERPHKNNVILELLETEDFSDVDKLMTFIEKVKSMGAQIAIDDFGSGYANLKMISMIKPDIIKIDGEIVKNVTNDNTMVSIMTAVTKIAETINADIVAEYIENEDIQKVIETNRIKYSQGYYYSKPLKVSSIKDYINK